MKKTDDELKQIAKDLYSGHIFCDRQVSRPEDIHLVWPILSLMDDKQMEDFKACKPYFIYEYLNKAGPTSINGMPTFFSINFLTEEETKKMFGFYDKVKSALESI